MIEKWLIKSAIKKLWLPSMRNLYIFLVLLFFAGCSTSYPRYQEKPREFISFKLRPENFPAPPYKPEYRRTDALIVIDAGHGGEDRGTTSLTKPYYQEKFLTLSTAKFLKEFLRQMGYRTLMTRNDDTFIPLLERAAIANEADADHALFVSVHYNSAPSSEANGIEVFFYQSEENKPRSKASKQLGAMVLDEVIQNTGAKSRGVKQGNFAVIRETKVPAILIEGGFMTNGAEMSLIKDPMYIKRLAFGIAKGVDHYIRTH